MLDVIIKLIVKLMLPLTATGLEDLEIQPLVANANPFKEWNHGMLS